MTVDNGAVGVLLGDPSNTLYGTASIYILSTLYGDNSFTLAAAAARSIAGSVAAQVNKKSGDVSIDASDKYTHYMALADKLDKQAALRGLGASSVYAGGISVSDKATQESNSDRTPPFFTRTTNDDLRDNSGTASLW